VSSNKQKKEKSAQNTCVLTPDHMRKINQLIKEAPERFGSVDEFLFRAIDIFLTWERNPQRTISKMTDMDPTMPQYALMSQMMDANALADMYPGYPEKFGIEWQQYLDSIPKQEQYPASTTGNNETNQKAIKSDFANMQKNLEPAREFIRQINFKTISKEGYIKVPYDGWPLLNAHYSRLLSSKLSINCLADLMKSQNSSFVKLDDFKAKAHDVLEEISMRITIYEKENKKTREEKVSTGLPKPPIIGERKTKHELAAQRYRHRYFGRLRKNRETGEYFFEGLLSALELIQVFIKKKEVLLTLTDTGKKFYMLDNPIFSGAMAPALSDDEGEFLSTKIISQRSLELKLIQKAIKIIGTNHALGSNMTDVLDEEFLETVKQFLKSPEAGIFKEKIQKEIVDKTEELMRSNNQVEKQLKKTNDASEEKKLRDSIKQTPIEACRIATMGRLTEIGVVDWKINTEGKSEFSISNSKLAGTIKKLA